MSFTDYKSTILFIPGIDPDKKTCFEFKSPPKKKKCFDKIPATFRSIDTWPTHTNIRCNWCTLRFLEIPLFIPKSIERMPSGDTSMDVSGCFCSFNCAQAYINNKIVTLRERINNSKNLIYLYKIINNQKIKEIEPSMNYLDLDIYGGAITEYEYKQHIQKLQQKEKTGVTAEQFSEYCTNYYKQIL